MTAISQHPYRVLIVDDELRDWACPMQEALEDLAKEKGIKLEIDPAEDKCGAENFLAENYYHLTSLDMRLPEKKGELLSVRPGIDLAKGFPWIGFPKLLIYSQMLRTEQVSQKPIDAMHVLQVTSDKYAKPTGSDADHSQEAIETLSVEEWAKRVIESLDSDKLELQTALSHGKRLTVVGAYLHHGVDTLPPLLATHLQTLANHWSERTNDRVDAAIRFIEATARLALVQSAVLCQTQKETLKLPSDDHIVTCLNTLEEVRPRLSGWNWSNYLTKEAIKAFQQARAERNEKGHTLTANNPQKHWAELRSPLQYAMDVAAYWVRHPLATELRYSRGDGWSAELLAGTANPRRRHALPSAMDFPTEATRRDAGVWQNVWRLPGTEGKEPERVPLSWDGWLDADTRTNTQWWFPLCQKDHRKKYIDLISGGLR